MTNRVLPIAGKLEKKLDPSLDLEDEITRETLITRDGDIVNPRARETTAPN